MTSLIAKPDRPIDTNERYALLVWLLISVWLFACALMVGGEFGDGYQTIVNARYFFGSSPEFFVQRGPLPGLVLLPVEAVAGALDLNPVDVRPYHIYGVLLHSTYLLGCWLLLRRTGEPFVPRAIAFLAAILSVVFYANAPYLSHDIIPGFLFLLLIFLCNRWIRKPTAALAALLVLIGTAVTFIKQTYAVFWIAICVYAVVAFLFQRSGSGISARKTIAVFALAAISGLLSWIGYAWFIGAEAPHIPFLERPLALTRSVWTQYAADGDIPSLFPQDIYLKNLHNFGIATVALVVPGVVLAFRRGDTRLRMVAVCWLVSVIMMQSVSFKEVRYLAFLAPLSAMLIVPVVSSVQRSRLLLTAVLAVLAVDQYRGLSMAAAQLSATPGMSVTRFVGDVEDSARLVSSDQFSFVYMADSPMLQDRYHGIFHLTAAHIDRLNGGRTDVLELTDPRDLGLVGARPGDRVLYSNLTAVRRPPWDENNLPVGLEDLIMSAGTATIINLNRSGERFLIEGHEDRYVVFVPLAESGKQMPVIASRELTAAQARSVYGDISSDQLQVLGIVVDALCQADQCTYF